MKTWCIHTFTGNVFYWGLFVPYIFFRTLSLWFMTTFLGVYQRMLIFSTFYTAVAHICQFSNGGRSKFYLSIRNHSPHFRINNTDATSIIVYFCPQSITTVFGSVSVWTWSCPCATMTGSVAVNRSVAASSDTAGREGRQNTGGRW